MPSFDGILKHFVCIYMQVGDICLFVFVFEFVFVFVFVFVFNQRQARRQNRKQKKWTKDLTTKAKS